MSSFYRKFLKDCDDFHKNKNIWIKTEKEIYFKKKYIILKKKYPIVSNKELYNIIDKYFYKKNNNDLSITTNAFYIDFHFN